MTDQEARDEAKKRWPKPRVAFHDGNYVVGCADGKTPGGIVALGVGATWEEAFSDADRHGTYEEYLARQRAAEERAKRAAAAAPASAVEALVRIADDYRTRAEKLDEAIKRFLHYTRKFAPGENPEDCVWEVPNQQLTELAEALKK